MATEWVRTPEQTREVRLNALGIRFLAGGEQTGGRVALVEHPIEPRSLAAPLHTHERALEVILVGQFAVFDDSKVSYYTTFS